MSCTQTLLICCRYPPTKRWSGFEVCTEDIAGYRKLLGKKCDPKANVVVISQTYLRHLFEEGNLSAHIILRSHGSSAILWYTLAQEHGDLIILHDWYQSFRAIILQKTIKERQRMKVSPSPKKRKMTVEPQNITTEASVQARFCRAITELQITTGLLRMPSKRFPNFVQRVAFMY
ncbi:origin of replication complex subunit 3 isoform X1 [Tanacetum coccineum]